MTEVFVLLKGYDYEGRALVGVISSIDLVEQRVEDLRDERGDFWCDSLHLHRVTVDGKEETEEVWTRYMADDRKTLLEDDPD